MKLSRGVGPRIVRMDLRVSVSSLSRRIKIRFSIRAHLSMKIITDAPIGFGSLFVTEDPFISAAKLRTKSVRLKVFH